MLARLAGPRLGGGVTPQGLTIEAHSQARAVRDADDPLLVGCDRPTQELGAQGVWILVELKQVVWPGPTGLGKERIHVVRTVVVRRVLLPKGREPDSPSVRALVRPYTKVSNKRPRTLSSTGLVRQGSV